MFIDFQPESPLVASTDKDAYASTYLMSQNVDVKKHPRQARLFTEAFALYQSLFELTSVFRLQELRESNINLLYTDKNIDRCMKAVHAVVARDIRIRLAEGNVPDQPKALEILWADGIGKFTNQRREEQRVSTRTTIAKMRQPEMYIYLKGLGIAELVDEIEELNAVLWDAGAPATPPVSRDEINAAKLAAQSMYFRVGAAVIGLNAMGSTNGAKLFGILAKQNDTYRSYRRNHLQRDATRADEVEMNRAFDATLPDIVVETRV
jgi:hypothetical protein